MIGPIPQSAAGFTASTHLAATHPNTPVGEICKLCAARFRVEAHYDDPWKTPITLVPLRVEYTDGTVISQGGPHACSCGLWFAGRAKHSSRQT